LPLEVFSRGNRERVMKSWTPNSHASTQDAGKGPSSTSAAIDPVVLSLKAFVMQRPTSYEGMKYQDLIYQADALASAKIEGLDVSLAWFKELVRRTLSHITANLDQPRNCEYVLSALSHLRKKLKTKASSKQTHQLNFALVALFEVLFETLEARGTQLDDLEIISRSKFSSLKEAFQICLLWQLENILVKAKKLSKSGKDSESLLTLRSIIDALIKSKVERSRLAKVFDEAKSFIASLDRTDIDIGRRLETFISIFTMSIDAEVVDSQFGGDISTVYGRQAIAEKTHQFIRLMDQHQKLELLSSLLESNWTELDKLWAIRHLIIGCEGLFLLVSLYRL
jgi:nucleolar pre-ribosomal-associated protein 2